MDPTRAFVRSVKRVVVKVVHNNNITFILCSVLFLIQNYNDVFFFFLFQLRKKKLFRSIIDVICMRVVKVILTFCYLDLLFVIVIF
jgi:hypothetical protein